MRSKGHCFLDLDGVVADFVRSSLAWHDIAEGVVPYDKVSWDFDKRIPGKTAEEFWTTLGEEFWATVEPTPEFGAIVEAVFSAWDAKDVSVLTSACQTKGCTIGKARWVEKHLPSVARRLIVHDQKHLFAKPHHFLIDDRTENYKDWIDNGGHGFLFPQPWNPAYYMRETTIPLLKNTIKGFQDRLPNGL